jgi:hypothetical protein
MDADPSADTRQLLESLAEANERLADADRIASAATVRPDIVALLVDLAEPPSPGLPGPLAHADGRPFTAEEKTLVRQASQAELLSAARYMSAILAVSAARQDAARRLAELLTPVWHDFATLGVAEAIAALHGADRAEAIAILDEHFAGSSDLVPPEIL